MEKMSGLTADEVNSCVVHSS